MWRLFRTHTKVFVSSAAVTVVLAVTAVEVAFPTMLDVLSPALGAMTLVVVELLGAMLIDLPLAGLCGFIVARLVDGAQARHGIVAGVVFLTMLFCTVPVLIASNWVVPYSAMYVAIRPAAQQARSGLGAAIPLYLVLFVLFDYLACAGFGAVGALVGGLTKETAPQV
jgi:hypothetical protein